ncbi:nuclear transcription factor Y subunit B-6-like [Bidens hawaiensis]|uniref:nuclear transcription factor Y subunit B-6-like n=1 Tax=Bidens hawaiensis TaxID=980011 RepID=UPI0040495FCE
MSKLGFDDYIEPLTVYLHCYREFDGGERGSIRGEPLIKRVSAGDTGPYAMGPFMPGFHMTRHHNGFFGLASHAGFFKDLSSAGGPSGPAGFESYAQCKE